MNPKDVFRNQVQAHDWYSSDVFVLLERVEIVRTLKKLSLKEMYSVISGLPPEIIVFILQILKEPPKL